MSTTITELRTRLQYQIDKLQEAIGTVLEHTSMTMEESEAALKQGCKLLDEAMASDDKAVTAKLGAEAMELNKKGNVASWKGDIERYKNTLTQDLVELTTKYVITDNHLVSPAGACEHDRIALKNNIMILTNKLPNHVDKGLCCYDVSKLDNTPYDLKNFDETLTYLVNSSL